MLNKPLLLIILSMLSLLSGKDYLLVTLDYPPYEYEENGEVKGVATEIIRETFKAMGDNVNIKLFPWKRSLEMVKTGQADAIFTIYHTSEREFFLDFSTEILMPQRTAFFVLSKSAIKYQSDMNDLAKYSFGTVLGVSYGEKFDSFIEKNQIKPQTAYDGETNMRGLLSGYYNILLSNEMGAKTILKKLNKSQEVRMLEPVIQDVPSYIAFSKQNKLNDLKIRFDKALKKLKSDGIYDKIVKKYL